MSDEKKEKKEQLRSKVQALVTYYEEEKRRNEELEMEIERLRTEQRANEFNQPAPSFRMDMPAPQPSYQMQHFAQPPAPAPAPQPATTYGSYGNRYAPAAASAPAAPAYSPQAAANCQRVVQCVEQLRARLQQTAYDNYNSPYGDYETLGLVDRLQEQLGDLCRELGVPAPVSAPAPAPAPPQPAYAPPAPMAPAPAMHYPPPPPRYY
ncbi:MAG: hypothetical protein FWD06_06875 [Oscillospiraceae bacterium]|nr:hypothetical protein [Oscillospiraceae bacterium]